MHENETQVQLPVRLVECRACFRVLRISIRRSGQKRGYVLNRADWPEKGRKSLLHQEHSFRHSPTVHLVRGDLSDLREPDRNYRA